MSKRRTVLFSKSSVFSKCLAVVFLVGLTHAVRGVNMRSHRGRYRK